jgi:hypothetical protein
MPSLKELFKTKPLPKQDGKTGLEAYDIRNSKDIPISTSNSILNATVFPIVQKTLRGSSLLTARTKETLIEEELVGLRAIRGLASPVIYGTDIIRLKRKTTNTAEAMKNSTNGGVEASNFILGSLAASVRDTGLRIASKLGITFPQNLIPTRVSENDKFANKKVRDTITVLNELKDGSTGSLLGKFLSDVVKGTPNQIGRQVIGTAISIGKDALRKKLATPFGLPNTPKIGILTDKEEETLSLRSVQNDVYDNKNEKYTLKINKRDVDNNGLSGILSDLYKNSLQYKNWVADKNQKDTINYANPKEKPFPEFSLDMITDNIPNRRTKQVYSKTDGIFNNSIETRLGMFNGSDRLNTSPTWYSEDGNPPKDAFEKTLDDYDTIPLRFYSIYKKTGVSFRATITGLNETFSPSWEPSKFVGNPYNFYTYGGIDRSVTFNLQLYALNPSELKRMWEKLTFLTTFVYPQSADIYTTPPFLKFTLGNMYRNTEGFVDSLSYTIDDNNVWEVGIPHVDKTGEREELNDMNTYKLPTIINVSMTIKFLETKSSYWDETGNPKRMYSYGSTGLSKQTSSEESGNMRPDGSAIENLPLGTPQRNVEPSISTDVLDNARKELAAANPDFSKLPTISGIKLPEREIKKQNKKLNLNIFRGR